MADVTQDILGIEKDELQYFKFGNTIGNSIGSFQGSDWFTRGWTLQELLAPKRLLFHNREWVYIGARENLASQISRKTGIDRRFLDIGYPRTNLDEASIAERMSWASRRQTTRAEDMAYCLLGLFGVNMPLLYGEGEKAFMRLQLEIIRNSDDESIFAWRKSERGTYRPWEIRQRADFRYSEFERNKSQGQAFTPRQFLLHSGLHAQEPLDFALSGHVKFTRGMKFARRLPYDMTNQGLRFYVDAYPSEIQQLTYVGAPFDAVLNCYTVEERKDEPVVITLMKEIAGYDQYWRRRDCRTFEGSFKRTPIRREEQIQTAFFVRQDGLSTVELFHI